MSASVWLPAPGTIWRETARAPSTRNSQTSTDRTRRQAPIDTHRHPQVFTDKPSSPQAVSNDYNSVDDALLTLLNAGAHTTTKVQVRAQSPGLTLRVYGLHGVRLRDPRHADGPRCCRTCSITPPRGARWQRDRSSRAPCSLRNLSRRRSNASALLRTPRWWSQTLGLRPSQWRPRRCAREQR